ncbi:ABC transporter permease subunit [Corynebacterium suedekumii]|nr:ABC transporter permease subunit [Corynebacterium suedekumii]
MVHQLDGRVLGHGDRHGAHGRGRRLRFSRYRFKARRPGLIALLIIQMFPQLLAFVAIFLLLFSIKSVYPWLGLNSLPGLILIYLGGSLGSNTFLMFGFFNTVPTEIDKAAYIDGATHSQVYWRIILPLITPSLVVVGMLALRGQLLRLPHGADRAPGPGQVDPGRRPVPVRGRPVRRELGCVHRRRGHRRRPRGVAVHRAAALHRLRHLRSGQGLTLPGIDDGPPPFPGGGPPCCRRHAYRTSRVASAATPMPSRTWSESSGKISL